MGRRAKVAGQLRTNDKIVRGDGDEWIVDGWEYKSSIRGGGKSIMIVYTDKKGERGTIVYPVDQELEVR